MANVAEFDELNNLEASVEELVTNVDSIKDEPNRAMMGAEIEDDIEELLIMAYVMGCDYANRVLDTEVERDVSKMSSVINEPVEGKTWKDRVREHIAEGDFGMIETVIRTESDRVYNEAVEETAEETELPNVYKTWVTMHDDRVRDTHSYIEGLTIPLDKRFYTIDGDSALRPTGFTDAHNNIGCRCKLKLSRK